MLLPPPGCIGQVLINSRYWKGRGTEVRLHKKDIRHTNGGIVWHQEYINSSNSIHKHCKLSGRPPPGTECRSTAPQSVPSSHSSQLLQGLNLPSATFYNCTIAFNMGNGTAQLGEEVKGHDHVKLSLRLTVSPSRNNVSLYPSLFMITHAVHAHIIAPSLNILLELDLFSSLCAIRYVDLKLNLVLYVAAHNNVCSFT